MISPKFFIEQLQQAGIEFFAGVPDSLLKNMCAYITDHFDDKHNIIAANEGGAVALAAGYHLATGKVGCVYMQNSGEGNAVNPLASLTDRDVYHIPLLLIIGWRGRPGIHDEPQHVKQGKITTGLLNVLGINYEVLNKEEDFAIRQIDKAINSIRTTGEAFALVVEKDTFDNYALQNVIKNDLTLAREAAVQMVAKSLEKNDVVVSTTGMISRELFEYREATGDGHQNDFLTVGSMGHASQIALGIALQKPNRNIFCFEGDGAVLMHTGSMAITASKKPNNFYHIVFNNGAHDSVGGQPTVALDIDLPSIAKAVGYPSVFSVDNQDDLKEVLSKITSFPAPVFLEIKVKKGNRKDLGRPTTTPIQNKEALMNFLK